MNHTQVWSKAALITALLSALASTCLAPSLAQAQQPATASAPPPPELIPLDEGEPPAVTIKKPGDAQSTGNSITEKRDHGQTKEIKVQSGPSTYYLKPAAQVGSSVPGDAQSGPPTGAQWVVKEFDWGGKKTSKDTPDTDSSK
jgi:hypothetical protein